MRGWGVIRTALGPALIAVALGHPGSAAGADATVRAGWWSQLAPAPAPPDVPEDGLHVSGGVNGPTAVAAIAYQLPQDAIATSLVLELVGTSPQADGLQACTIPLAAAAFEPAQNGAWSDLPAYDCEAGAVPVEVDGATATFAIAALQQGQVLAVALVPGPTDRASIAKPDTVSLASTMSSSAPPASGGFATPASASAAPSGLASASPPFTPPAMAAPAVAEPAAQVADDVPAAADAAITAQPASTTTKQPWRTRVGGALGFVLLLAALLFYSQGRGLLGARVGNT